MDSRYIGVFIISRSSDGAAGIANRSITCSVQSHRICILSSDRPCGNISTPRYIHNTAYCTHTIGLQSSFSLSYNFYMSACFCYSSPDSFLSNRRNSVGGYVLFSFSMYGNIPITSNNCSAPVSLNTTIRHGLRILITSHINIYRNVSCLNGICIKNHHSYPLGLIRLFRRNISYYINCAFSHMNLIACAAITCIISNIQSMHIHAALSIDSSHLNIRVSQPDLTIFTASYTGSI